MASQFPFPLFFFFLLFSVRFGSTETCLQVCGTPLSLTEAQRFAAFKVGWNHTVRNAKDGSTQPQPGYYIG